MNELKWILKFFPKLKLSYENILDKKVYAQAYMLIPKGLKAFIWFTYIEDNNIAFLLKLDNKNKIIGYERLTLVFHDDLSNGTILFGTLINLNGKRLFSCENIYYYKGENINFIDFRAKMNIMTDIFNSKIKQISYNVNMVIVGMSVIRSSFNAAINETGSLTYPVYSVRYYNFNSGESLGNYLIRNRKSEAIFEVKASLESDIYYLYCHGSTEKRIAYIPSYSQSLMMNSIFRKIRENSNLDLIEESDDEEEFQDSSIDKHVNLDLIVKMRCIFNIKFKKWEPRSIVHNSCVLIRTKDLAKIESTIKK